MKRTVSLFEFVPYGAPELLEARRPFLARALALSSLLALAAFLAALPLTPLVRLADAPRRAIVDLTDIIVGPPPLLPDPEPPHVQPAHAKVKAADGILTPAPELEAPPIDDSPVTGTGIDAAGTGPASISGEPDTRATDSGDPLPARGTWVYTDRLPEPRIRFKPEYPHFARDAGVEGLVAVDVLVGKDGRVVRAEIVENYSILLLDQTALDAARRWVFEPAVANGHPVACWFRIPFHFVLHE